MKNLKVDEQNVAKRQLPRKIIFSEASTAKAGRQVHFSNEIAMLKEHFDPADVIIEQHKFSRYTLAEQAELVSDASIFVTACGGGAVTATLMPRGSTVIIYYKETGGIKSNKGTNLPARLDWDIFNNLGYVRTFWVPVLSKYDPNDQRAFVKLIEHELLQNLEGRLAA
jgi:capsular polysaccharide biosynthesis protein